MTMCSYTCYTVYTIYTYTVDLLNDYVHVRYGKQCAQCCSIHSATELYRTLQYYCHSPEIISSILRGCSSIEVFSKPDLCM